MTGTRPPATAGTGLAVALAAVSVALSATPRILLAAGALPDAARPFIWSDVYATYVNLLAGGKLPYSDTFFDYPPGIGYLAGAFARVASGPVVYVLLWSAVAVVAAAGIALLLAREATPARTIVCWSLSPQLLLYGGANFDVLPLALLVGGVVAARRGRSSLALAILAMGTLVKVFPAVAVPALLERTRRARGAGAAVAGAAIFVSIVAIVAAPSMAAPHPSTEGFLFQATRTNFDSVWGLMLAGLHAARVPGAPAIVGWLSLLGLVATSLVVIRRADPRTDPARLAFLGLLALLLCTRLYSPQYSLWVLPFFALLSLPVRRFALLSIADIAVFATVYPLTLVGWSASDPVPTILFAVLAAGIVLRHASLVLIWRRTTRCERCPRERR